MFKLLTLESINCKIHLTELHCNLLDVTLQEKACVIRGIVSCSYPHSIFGSIATLAPKSASELRKC